MKIKKYKNKMFTDDIYLQWHNARVICIKKYFSFYLKHQGKS